MNSSRYLLALTLTVAAAAGVGAGGYFLYRYLFPPPAPQEQPPEVRAAGSREAIPVPQARFTDVTAAAGIDFAHVNGAAGRKLLPETMGSGVAFLDFDNDGDQDLLFVNSRPWPGHEAPDPPPTAKLYRNNGDGTFADVTAACGMDVALYGMGVTAGDFDNDGWTDVAITAVGGTRLFRNEAGGAEGRRFADVTRAAGLPETVWPNGTAGEFLKREEPIPWASSATFLDYDGDARLDLFVCHYVTWSPAVDLRIEATLAGLERAYVPPTQFEGAQCALYRNADGRRFEDVSAEAGVQVFVPEGVGTGARQRSVGKSLGVVVCDPDADGWPDVIVANDTVQNFFFHNVPAEDGRGRRFEEIGLIAGVAYAEGTARGGMGIDWGEYRPGRCAAVIANFSNEPTTFLGLDSPQRLLFSDNALAVGLYGPTRLPLKFGTFFFDYDLDGRLDLLTANGHLEPEITKVQQSQTYAQPAQLFWNTGRRARQFEPVTEKDAGPDLFKPIVGRGSAFADIDRDGDLDVVLTANNGPPLLLRNDQKLGHHWVRLVLEGDGERSNRSAVGAEVELHAGGEVQRRSVRAGRGYLSQSELPLTFGLGKADKIDRVVVRWPGRDTEAQEWKDLAADREHVLKQKAGGTD